MLTNVMVYLSLGVPLVIAVPQLFFPPQVGKFTLGRLSKGRQSSSSNSSSSSGSEALLYPPPGQRCKGRNYGDRRCCTPETPCGLGEGDCDGPGDGGQHDGNAGCKGNLVCGSNNCKKFGLYFHEKDDCCEKPPDVVSNDRKNPTPTQIFPGVPVTPKPGQRCAGRNFGQRRCCSPSQPCDEGEGDCDGRGDGGQHDGDAGCKGDLVCGSNNCKKFGSYYHEKDDCCERKPSHMTSPLMKEPDTIVKLNPSNSGSSGNNVPVVCSSPLCLGAGPRCQGRNVDTGRCCTADNPCEEGEGDCDNSSECVGGLVCGNNNCQQFGSVFHPKDDCCVRPRAEDIVDAWPRCQGRNVDKGRCCTASNPCVEGEGDCDNDQECGGGLVCGDNNCQQFSSIFHPKDDCCVKPAPPVENFGNIVDLSPRCQGRNVDKGRCCTASNPCVEGEGDCDSDQECGGGLVCGDNNCKQFGDVFHPKDDCCVKPQASSQPQKTAPPADLSIPFEPKPGQRCAGRNYGDRRCCTPENPCDEGEGDCDGPGDGGNNDGHRGCRGDLVCGSNNCKKFGHFYHEKDDCCEKPSFVQNAPVIQIPKGVWQEPPAGEKCSGRNYHGRRCCTPDNPCDVGEGDCDGPGDGGQHDGNAGCRGDLVCGSNNCLKFGAYFHPKDDCCENPDGSGGWTEWQSWSTCTKTCGAGRKKRNKYCKGRDCSHTTQSQERWCNFQPCPK